MHINNIKLEGFRNYKSFQTDFHPGINLICGKNAQGKTNLLEAIYILSAGRSHRSVRDVDMIGFDEERAEILAHVEGFGRVISLEMKMGRSIRRSFYKNGVHLKKKSEQTGIFTTVMFQPDDLDLVKGPPSRRRSEIDGVISQLRPLYGAALSEFNRLYSGKLKILRLQKEKPSLLYTLDEYNDGLCRVGARLVFYRAAFVKKLAEFAKKVHHDCSGGLEDLEILYRTEKGVDIERPDKKAIYAALWERQKKHRENEIMAGKCLVGAQRDDLEISINGLLAKTFASQGQTRTAALSLKLAERDLICEDTGEAPVLLLDDVLSELDEKRREFVQSRITGGQVLITSASLPAEKWELDTRPHKTILIENGGLKM